MSRDRDRDSHGLGTLYVVSPALVPMDLIRCLLGRSGNEVVASPVLAELARDDEGPVRGMLLQHAGDLRPCALAEDDLLRGLEREA